MKIWTMIIGIGMLLLTIVFIDYSWALIALLFENFKSVTIREWSTPYSEDYKINIKEVIPRIIHQTWKNETIPEKWAEAYDNCKKLHPNYEHILWTDEKARNFIAQEYPWFLHQYDKYPYTIQRVDSLRYFILVRYGGIYIDLDIECLQPLDPLLSYSAWLRTTKPTGISNDVMGSIPYHPFFLYVINHLKSASRNWVFPYITVMATTGPLFLSVMLEKYMHYLPSNAIAVEHVRIITSNISNQTFKDFHGSTWHHRDARFFFWTFKMENQFIGLKVEVILNDNTVVQGQMTGVDSVNRCLFLKNIFFKSTGKYMREMCINGSNIKDLNFISSFNAKKKKKRTSNSLIDPAIISISNRMQNSSFQESSFSSKKLGKNTALLSSSHLHEKRENFETNYSKSKNIPNKCIHKTHIYKKKKQFINTMQKECCQLKNLDHDNWINDDVNKYRDEEFDFQGNLGRFDKHKVFSEIRKLNMMTSNSGLMSNKCLSKNNLFSDIPVSTISTISTKKKKSSLTENNHSLFKINEGESKPNNEIFLSNRILSNGYDKSCVSQQKIYNYHFNSQQSLSSFDRISKKIKKLRNIRNNLECPCIKPSKMIEAEYISTFNTGISNEMIIENAARGISFLVTQLLDDFFKFDQKKINFFTTIILVGNNQTGIYATAAGRQLCNHGIKVIAVIVNESMEKQMLTSLQNFSDAGGKIVSIDELFRIAKSFQTPSELIIDAIFGCHYSLADIVDDNIRNKIHSLIEWANQCESNILSLDLPSGLDIITGVPILSPYFLKSKWVLSLGLPKTGLLFALRSKYVTKELFLADIGISRKVWKKIGVGKRVKALWIGQDWVIRMSFS
ncbi:hypothetical protein PMAC_000143 [Pneumocystis sp. 'macacae']|nr:hypothetical protein PMAC_000143 [Pneumocystis sp. 'macacae']